MRLEFPVWAVLPALSLLACGAQEQPAPVAETGEGYVLLGELPSGVDLAEAVAQLPAGGFGVLADPGTGQTATLVSTSSPLYARVASGEYSVASPAACLDCGDPTCTSTTRTIGISLTQDGVTPGELYWVEPTQTRNFTATSVTPPDWPGKLGDTVNLQIAGTLPTCASFAYYFEVVADDAPPEVRSILFSEYGEGSSNNKYIEIANTGNVDFNLAGCSVRVYANGNTSPNSTIHLGGDDLAPGEVFLVCHSSAVAPTNGTCDISTVSLSHNGDDALELICDGTVYDVFGRIGERQTWGSPPTTSIDATLRRNCDIIYGDTDGSDPFDPADEWTGHGNDNRDDLGLWHCAP